MASLRLVEVDSRKLEKAFFAFPLDLYAGCPQYVPPLLVDEIETFDRSKNPVFENADAKRWLAIRDGKTIGRIAGIVNYAYNDYHKVKRLRFGWFDCVNEYPVAAALFGAVEEWGRALGMDELAGPLGFSKFDKEGMLTDGYDQLPTMATYYNYPYYNDLVERHGFETGVDWVEYRILNVGENGYPPRLAALAETIKKRRGYRVLEFKTKKALLEWADEFLALVEEAYAELDGFTPISARQKDYYTKKFFPMLNRQLVKGVLNDKGQLIGLFVAVPSISTALQKAKGRLLPFGVWHLWRAMKGSGKVLDLCLAAVKKAYRGAGVDIVMGAEMYKSAVQLGFTSCESNPELVTNHRVRSEWRLFEHVQHKRRRVYCKPIGTKPGGQACWQRPARMRKVSPVCSPV